VSFNFEQVLNLYTAPLLALHCSRCPSTIGQLWLLSIWHWLGAQWPQLSTWKHRLSYPCPRFSPIFLSSVCSPCKRWAQAHVWIWLASLHHWRSPTSAHLARCAWWRCALSPSPPPLPLPPSPHYEDLGHPTLGGRLLLCVSCF
jgi:hypothetical protein